MLRPRVIPVLLLKGAGLYKTVRFREPAYVGDPLNTVRIFNDKEVDEICVLDIGARFGQKAPQFERIRELAAETFMPISYGGCIASVDQVKAILKSGVEKVVLNSLVFNDPDEVRRIVAFAGSSSVVVSLDVRRNWLRRQEVMTDGGCRATRCSPVEAARTAEALGAGEILLNAIDRDGTRQGYDLEMVDEVARAVSVPVVACGGANNLDDLRTVLAAGASAAAAGSMFVYQGRHRAVLISYPSPAEIEGLIPGLSTSLNN
jgi:imidazole glycerol-phosphate synthase subunit HisF